MSRQVPSTRWEERRRVPSTGEAETGQRRQGAVVAVSFTSGNDRDRALTVPADRRFLKAV